MYKTIMSVVFAIVSFGFSFAATSQENVEPLLDIPRDTRTGGAPSPASIEKAYGECLKGVDAEFAAVGGRVAHRTEARKSEEEVCHRARRECIANPASASCKGFVVDYAE